MDESGTAANLDERKPALSTQARGRAGRRKAEKEKAGPAGPAKAAHRSTGLASLKREFFSTQRMGSGKAEAACIAETLSSGDRV